MFARMCLLETIPGAFDSYVPPAGINVSWFWDFKGKRDGQVIGFFTAQEISTNDYDVHKDGDIKNEVERNRCFLCLKTIPEKDWNKVIPDFTFSGQTLSIPKDHPSLKEEWKPKQKKKIRRAADGSETTEELEFEAEMDADAFTHINEIRHQKKMGVISVSSDKIRTEKQEGNKKPVQKITIPFVKVVDEIKAEKD